MKYYRLSAFTLLYMFVVLTKFVEGNDVTSSPTVTTTVDCNVISLQGDCEACVKHTQCYYCTATGNCSVYPYSHFVPKTTTCGMSAIRWGVCWVNFEALIIAVSVIAGVLIISIVICCCCCCRKKKKNRYVQEQAKREREKEERRIRQQERQKDRQSKNDEIRKKYGLVKDDHPYQRFDA